MHCEGNKIYSQPENCPVCGMDLVPIPVNHPEKARIVYYCPMHCEDEKTYEQPGNCPICGMDLVPMAADTEDAGKGNSTYQKLLHKFKIATVFTLPIFIIAMWGMIAGNPLHKLMEPQYWNWVEMLLSIPVVFYATWMFFERAWRSIRTRNLNMFTLIGIGAGIAWLFSFVAILFPGILPAEFKMKDGTVHVYFESATVILTLVLLGQLLEARAHGKTNSAIRQLLKLAPNTAIKIIDGAEVSVSIDDIDKGDLLRVKPGEKIPVDGILHEGETYIDESMITGEPIPVSKLPGDIVRAGTINGNKTFTMEAEKVGSETLLSQIIEMVNKASRSRAPIQNLADKISGYFVPIVVIIAVITFIVWAIWGPYPSQVYALVNAVAVLIIACPCALGLATPMSVMVGVGRGAQSGVLIKNAGALEKMNKINVLVVDKTGTLTEGKPSVEKVVPAQGSDENELLRKIVSLNIHSEHPLATATSRYGKEKRIRPDIVSAFETVAGKGVKGIMNHKQIFLGNASLITSQNILIPEQVLSEVVSEQSKGKTISFLAEEDQFLGYIVIADKIKASAIKAINKLKQEGLEVWMFTGDNELTARSVSDQIGLEGFKAGMLPGDKMEEIKKLQSRGKKVAMAGDGINDAPALTQADIGIAMGTGTDIAIESAEITLVNGDLTNIAKARSLSQNVMKNIKQNLFFALGYNMLGIPIAAGILYPVSGLLLSPMIAALAMSFSSVSVISNSLRLRKTRL